MEHQPHTIEEKIMKKIDTDAVKVRSKYIFLAEKLGLGSIILLSILFGAVFLHLLFYYLNETDNLVYLSFGKEGIYAFLESFPYLLVISFLLLVCIAAYLLKKTDSSYQKPLAYSSFSLLVVVMVAGAALMYTGLGEVFEKAGYNEGPGGKMIRPFLQSCFMQRKYGISGQIIAMTDDALLLKTPDGFITTTFQNSPPLDPAVLGKFIVIVGKKKGDGFEATHIQIIPQERVPVIGRGVQHRFPPPPPGPGARILAPQP